MHCTRCKAMKKRYMVIITLNNQGLIRSLFGFQYSTKHCHACCSTPWVSELWPRNNTGWFSPFRDSVSFYNTVDHRSPWRYIFTGRVITVRSSGSALFCVWALSSWSWCLSNGQQETTAAAAWAKGPGGKALAIRGPWCACQCHTDVMESHRPSASLPTTAVLHVPVYSPVAHFLGVFFQPMNKNNLNLLWIINWIINCQIGRYVLLYYSDRHVNWQIVSNSFTKYNIWVLDGVAL